MRSLYPWYTSFMQSANGASIALLAAAAGLAENELQVARHA
jgi:hypothetical protein